jgi:hypothetical protein
MFSETKKSPRINAEAIAAKALYSLETIGSSGAGGAERRFSARMDDLESVNFAVIEGIDAVQPGSFSEHLRREKQATSKRFQYRETVLGG